MTTPIWKRIITEILAGTRNQGHPFRYATLATIGLDQIPRLRTIRLRDFDPEDLGITFFTDSRSKKMLHIKENNKVSLLLYHPEELLQLRIEGLAIRERDAEVLSRHWQTVEGKAQHDYTTLFAPGTEIANPDTIEYLQEEDYFSVVQIHPFKIEYLQLKRPNHVRVRFSKHRDSWLSNFLVP
jgi:pyridoxine/pyridoxamine 5'-phosphate oxidase